MKAVLLITAIAAAVAVTAPGAFAKQGYRYLGDTLSAVVEPAQAEGITLTTDTLGGSGQPRMAHAYQHVTDTGGNRLITDTLGGNGQPGTFAPSQPYIYGGAPPAVAQAGSGFYRAHLSPPPATSSGDGFNWGDAGLGAVTGFGALFLLAGASMLVRRRNQQLAL
jgi:hypothetical protein